MRIVGRPELIDEPWFADHTGRARARRRARRRDPGLDRPSATPDEVIEAFAEGQAAIAPIYSIADIVDDPQYLARETITTVDHPKLGPLQMQNVIPRMSETPGRIAQPGRRARRAQRGDLRGASRARAPSASRS